MKKLLFVLFVFISFVAKSQIRYPTGFPTQYNSGWNRWGYAMSDSGLIVANRDTNWLPKYSGTVVFRPADKKFYWFDSTILDWSPFASSIDTTSLSNRINLKLNIVDTTNKWWGIGKRWVDTVYRVNDSTVGFKINGGVQQTFQILGRAATGGGAGTVTSVALSMPSAFSVSGSPITGSGTFNVSGAGTTSQYIRGNGTLATTDTGMIPSFYLKTRSLFSATSPLSYNSTTGVFGVANANVSGQKGVATFLNSDFSDNGSGLISLSPKVSNGSCTNCTVTFGADGRATAYSSGTGPTGASVDTIYRVSGVDSIYYTINSTLYAIKDSSGSSETADNGLTKTGNNIQLGGALTKNTSITSADPTYRISITGNNTFAEGALLDVVSTGDIGYALRGETTNGRGVLGVATTGVGVFATALGSGGYGIFSSSTDGSSVYSTTNAEGLVFDGVSIPTSTNTVIPVMSLTRSAQSGGGNGIGGSIEMSLHTTAFDRNTNKIIYKLTDATDASYTSQMEFWNANSATVARKAALAGTGQWTWDGYPALTAQTDTATYKPVAIDASGNVVKMNGWTGAGSGQNINRTLLYGNIDTLTAIQFGYPDTGFVQALEGSDRVGTPMVLYPYTSRDTSTVTPRKVSFFKTITNNYDGSQPLNTITEIFKYGSNNLSDHYFRIAAEQNYYNNGEFHGFEYKLDGVGAAIRGMSATWNWDTVDLSTTTFRAGQFAYQPALSDTQMLYTAPNLTRFTGFRTPVPDFQVRQYSTDGTKGGMGVTTQNNFTLYNLHLNSGSFHSALFDLPYAWVTGTQRTINSQDPEYDHRFAGRLASNRMIQYSNGSRKLGVLGIDQDSLTSWTFGGDLYLLHGAYSVNVKSIRNRKQKPFAISIAANSADTSVYKVPFALDTLGRIAINVPNPQNTWADPLLGLTDSQMFRVYGATLLDSTTYIRRVTLPPSTYNVLVHGLTDSIIYQVPLSAIGATTIYNGNGTLSGERNVSSGGFTVRFDGANNSDTIMSITNTGTNGIGAFAYGTLRGLDVQSPNLGMTVFGTTQGMQTKATTQEGIFAQSDGMRAGKFVTNLAATNTVDEILNLQRAVNSGVGADGIGAVLTLSAENTSGTQVTTAQLAGRFTSATAGAELSEVSLIGVNNSATNTVLRISGDGSLTSFGKRIIAVSVSSAGTLTLGNSHSYVFSGTTATWTLPAVSGNTGVIYLVKNRGSGNITLNSNAGGNDIYDTSAVNTITISAGAAKILMNDGTYWTVQ